MREKNSINMAHAYTRDEGLKSISNANVVVPLYKSRRCFSFVPLFGSNDTHCLGGRPCHKKLSGKETSTNAHYTSTAIRTMTDTANNKKEEERIVKLISRDDQEFELPLAAAVLSRMVSNSLGMEDGGDGGEDEEEATADTELKVDVMRVSGACLEKVVAFLKHHHEQPMDEITMPLPGPTFEEVSRCMDVVGII